MARENLKKLKQVGPVYEYVKELSSWIFDIRNMEDDKLFNYRSRLQPWAQAEFWWQGVKDLDGAVIAADSLVNCKLVTDINSSNQRKNKERRSKARFSKTVGKRIVETSKAKPMKSARNKNNALECYICEGPHLARDCPKQKLNSIVLKDESEQVVV